MVVASGSSDGCGPRGFYQRASISIDRLADRDFLVAHHRLELAAALVGGPGASRVALFLFSRHLLLALGLLALVGFDRLGAPFLLGGRARELLVVLDAPRLGGGIDGSRRCLLRRRRGRRRLLRRALSPGSRQCEREAEQRGHHE